VNVVLATTVIDRRNPVALTASQRSTILKNFAPMLGEEVAEALLSQFPANDLETPATRDFVRAECIALKSDVTHQIDQLRTELKAEIGDVRTELKAEIGDLRTELQRELRLHLVATLTFVGALLTAFRLL